MATSELHGVLIVDKARGPTSHDVVGVARRVLGTREIGHTGTLDPMATGVLVLVVGEATKLVNSLAAKTKRYEATIRLGTSTHTLDAEGEPDEHAAVPPLRWEEVLVQAAAFVGDIDQRAPIVSALKLDGQSLHKRVRRGELVEAPVRRVRLEQLALRGVRADEIDLTLTCGAGFYVRSLARDLARSLGTCGHLAQLRRTHNGLYSVDDAVDFELMRRARSEESLREAVRARLIPLAQVCRALPHVALDDAGVVHARHGRLVPVGHVWAGAASPARPSVAFDAAGAPVALVELVPPLGEHLRVVRGFRTL